MSSASKLAQDRKRASLQMPRPEDEGQLTSGTSGWTLESAMPDVTRPRSSGGDRARERQGDGCEDHGGRGAPASSGTLACRLPVPRLPVSFLSVCAPSAILSSWQGHGDSREPTRPRLEGSFVMGKK